MNASQERQEDVSSQNEQQEKTLTPKKSTFTFFQENLKCSNYIRLPKNSMYSSSFELIQH